MAKSFGFCLLWCLVIVPYLILPMTLTMFSSSSGTSSITKAWSFTSNISPCLLPGRTAQQYS